MTERDPTGTKMSSNDPGSSSRSTATRLRDGMARTSGLQPADPYSGGAGAFVASLFAVALLAIMFIALSHHLNSHWKAAVVVGAGAIAWIQLAAFIRSGLGRRRRHIRVFLGAAAVLAIAAGVYYGLGIQVLKWFAIVVAGFYLIRIFVDLLERYCRPILLKVLIWLVLLTLAIAVTYRVQF